jgi:hypothetical protein
MRGRSVCIQHFIFIEDDANEVLSSLKHRKRIDRNSVLMQDIV